MIARYRITEQDYVRAMRLFSKPGRRSLLVQTALGACLGLALLFVVPRMSIATFLGLLAAGIGVGAAMFWGVRRVLVPATARRHYRRYKAMADEFTFELLDEGVRFTSPHGVGTLVWSHMLKWRQNDDYVLIHPMPNLFHIVPKSIAGQGFDVVALTERLRERVGAPV